MSFSLTTTQAGLYGLLKSVSGVVRNSSTHPILRNVLLRSESGMLVAVASDLEIEMIGEAKLGPITGRLETTVECHKLLDILGTIPSDEELTLTAENSDSVTLSGPSGKFKLSCLPAADFPRMQVRDDLSDACTIGQDVFKSVIERTAFAMAVKDIRFYLNGLSLVLKGDVLQVCATDGHRMAIDLVPVKVQRKDQSSRDVIIPRSSVMELKRLNRSGDLVVQVQLCATQARFKLEGAEMVTKLVEGRFPEVERAIPRQNLHSVTVNRSVLLLALQRAAILADGEVCGVRMVLASDLASSQLRLESKNASSEIALISIEVGRYTGPRIEIGINAKYLIDLLQSLACPDVTLSFGETLVPSPVLVTVPGDSAFKYVVMPMKLA